MTKDAPGPGTVDLEVDGQVAIITNNNPEKRNAFGDDMDVQLFEILAELAARTHTLVVDGANWQRRALTNPPVVTIRDQTGRGPFAIDPG